MHIARRSGIRGHRLANRCFTQQVSEPPRAGLDQIFRDSTRLGTSLGTEDDWQAALRAQEELEQQQQDNKSSRPVQDDVSLFASNRIGQVVLPPPLIEATNKLLKHVHGPSIRQTSLRFYESLRLKNEGKKADVPMPSSQDFTGIEADAYIAGFMPQVYASVYTVLVELRKKLGQDWQPQRVLDCGMGPGTAALAFQEVFGASSLPVSSSTPELIVIESNNELRNRARHLWEQMMKDEAYQAKIYPTKGSIKHQYDVILAPHALDDCKGRPSERLDIVRDLWSRLAPDGVLLLLERGNPAGFERIAAARQHLLRKHAFSKDVANDEAHILAPCPGDGQCPMYTQGHDPTRRQWCHFSQRLQRPDFLQRTRHAKDNIEDVNYSYIVVRKGTRPRPPLRSSTTFLEHDSEASESMSQKDIVSSSYSWSRIVMPPLKRHKHIIFDICSVPEAAAPSAPSIKITKHSTKARRAALQKQVEQEAAQVDAEAQDQETVETNSDVKWADRAGPILQRATVPRSQGVEEYKFARRAHWGDLLPFRGKIVVDRDDAAERNTRKGQK